MSSGSGAEDCCAGRPPGDESNTSRFCRDAEAAAVAAPGAELGRGGVQLGGAAVDGLDVGAMLGTSGEGSSPVALAKKPLDCNKSLAKGANAASSKVRHSLTLFVLFCLYSFFSNCISLNLLCSFIFTDTVSQ